MLRRDSIRNLFNNSRLLLQKPSQVLDTTGNVFYYTFICRLAALLLHLDPPNLVVLKCLSRSSSFCESPRDIFVLVLNHLATVDIVLITLLEYLFLQNTMLHNSSVESIKVSKGFRCTSAVNEWHHTKYRSSQQIYVVQNYKILVGILQDAVLVIKMRWNRSQKN